jgi:glucose-6-phosphate isomerase
MSRALYLQQFKNISRTKNRQNESFTAENSYHKNFEYKNFKKFRLKCVESAKVLRSEIKAQKLEAIDIVFAKNDLPDFEELAKKIAVYKKVLVLGVGGSSLGGKTLSALKFQNRLEFLESIDPETVKNCLTKTDLKNTFFLVISKSGETIETICQTLIIIDAIKRAKISDFGSRFLFITESDINSLAKIAKKIGAPIVNHPQAIGGRYSCFSIVGLLPASLAGLEVKKIRAGARKILNNFLTKDDIVSSCAIQLALYEQGFTNNVIMPYIDNLKNFTDWYRQLWAESLGKNNFGSVPINSMGTIDQHSQLQLYLEGPRDKFFTFLTQKNNPHDFLIKDLAGCKTLFGSKKLSKIIRIEQETTIAVLSKKKLPVRIFKIEKLDEEVLGGLMMQMFLETILIAYVKKIDPFNQPAVELRKELAKKILKQNA